MFNQSELDKFTQSSEINKSDDFNSQLEHLRGLIEEIKLSLKKYPKQALSRKIKSILKMDHPLDQFERNKSF